VHAFQDSTNFGAQTALTTECPTSLPNLRPDAGSRGPDGCPGYRLRCWESAGPWALTSPVVGARHSWSRSALTGVSGSSARVNVRTSTCQDVSAALPVRSGQGRCGGLIRPRPKAGPQDVAGYWLPPPSRRPTDGVLDASGRRRSSPGAARWPRPCSSCREGATHNVTSGRSPNP